MRVSSRSWTAVCAVSVALAACEGGSTAPPADGGVPADAPAPDRDGGPRPAFDVNAHGFGFENYGNDSSPANLSPASVARLFGDVVCASGSGDTCMLTTPAAQWMEESNGIMGGGHCYGMAVLSSLFYTGESDTMTFGASRTFDIANGAEIQREIAYWFILQTISEVRGTFVTAPPATQVETLRTSFAGGAERYALAFWKRGFKSGHAVLPYALRDMGGGIVEVLLYDNNFPGVERVMTVDTGANTWRYSASTNPMEAEGLYEGDADTETLVLAPISPHRPATRFACPFCGDYAAGSAGMRTVSTTGNADVLLENEMGQRLGTMGDALVQEIPGARVTARLSADLWRDDPEPLYDVPSGSSYRATFSGAALDTASESSLSVTGPGYYVGVESVTLEPGQVDMVEIGRDEAAITYVTSGMETADVVLAVQTAGADWAFVLRSYGDSAGQSLAARADLTTNVLEFSFAGADALSQFDILVYRVDAASELLFFHSMIEVDNGALLSLFFGDWDTDGEMLVLAVDTDGDGTVDASVDLADEALSAP